MVMKILPPNGAGKEKRNTLDNLLTAGRIISAEGEGWEIVRVIPVCALTGESAGKAAAISVKDNMKITEFDAALLGK